MGPVNIAALKRGHDTLRAQLRHEIVQAADDAGRFAVNYSLTKANEFKLKSPSKTREATKYKVVLGNRVVTLKLTNRWKVAGFLEGGTKPHKIIARRRKALRFVVDGNVVFRKSVNHPGTRATHWFSNLANQTFEFFQSRVNAGAAKAARNFNKLR